MRPSLCMTAFATACWLLLAGPAQAAGPVSLEPVFVEGSRVAISKWFRAESQHFIVYSDTSTDDVRTLLDNLEKLDHLHRKYMLQPQPAQVREPKLTLYYQRGGAALAEIDAGVPDLAVGLYSSCVSGVQGFNAHLGRIPSLRDDQLNRAPLDETLSYVFEAYARHFVYRHTDIRTPSSFVHGFALYFSSARFSDKQMVVGRMPPALAHHLNLIDDGEAASLTYDDVLLQKLDVDSRLVKPAAVRLEFEAKTWQLTHYMMSTDDRRQRMDRYLALTRQGLAAPAAFETAFEIKMPELPALIGQYTRGQALATRISAPSQPTAQVKFQILPRAAGKFILADAALKSCPGPQAGAELLQKVTALAARFPADEFAQLTLSRAQINWGDPQDALPRLETLLKDEETHVEARTLLGTAHLRLAERSEGGARRTHLQAARRHLQQVAGSDAPAPDVALALFQTELTTAERPDGTTLDRLTTAWRAAREVDALTRSAALAYAFAGKGDDAHAALALLALPSRDDPLARWARQWQSRLEAGVSRRDILAEMRAAAPADLPFRDWTMEKIKFKRCTAPSI